MKHEKQWLKIMYIDDGVFKERKHEKQWLKIIYLDDGVFKERSMGSNDYWKYIYI